MAIALDGTPHTERKQRPESVRAALIARIGDDAAISVGSVRIFVYTGTAEAAAGGCGPAAGS